VRCARARPHTTATPTRTRARGAAGARSAGCRRRGRVPPPGAAGARCPGARCPAGCRVPVCGRWRHTPMDQWSHAQAPTHATPRTDRIRCPLLPPLAEKWSGKKVEPRPAWTCARVYGYCYPLITPEPACLPKRPVSAPPIAGNRTTPVAASRRSRRTPAPHSHKSSLLTPTRACLPINRVRDWQRG